VYVDTAVIAQRLGVTMSELDPMFERLAEQRVILPGLTPGTYGVQEWTRDGDAG
jgi:hypothetical protein